MWDVGQRWACTVKVKNKIERRSAGIVPLYHADEIAYKNGLVCAERFTKKYDGQTVNLDFDTLKIIGGEDAKD